MYAIIQMFDVLQISCSIDMETLKNKFLISILLLVITYKNFVPAGQDYTVSAIKKKNSVCPPDGSSRISSRRPSKKPDPELAGPGDVFKAINS